MAPPPGPGHAPTEGHRGAGTPSPGHDAFPWSSGEEPSREPAPDELRRSAKEVARSLLGLRLVSTVDGEATSGVIVETEAYTGPDDPASHAARRIGRTPRNETMFGPAGRAYVYRSYGIHWCLNVVTGSEGHPQAVLLRALEPREGHEIMARRRERPTELCSGPGRLAQALGVTGALDGHDLRRQPLRLSSGWSVPADRVGVSGRIGISRATEAPLRFYVRSHPSISGSPRA